jgi:membrane protein implicated in regulation of membrane protease activity
MFDKLERLTSNKPYYWFWFVFCAGLGILDIATGSVFLGVWMLLLAAYWTWVLYTTYKGTNRLYNKHHPLKD